MLPTHPVFFLPQPWNPPLLQRNPLASFIREWPLETKMLVMNVIHFIIYDVVTYFVQL